MSHWSGEMEFEFIDGDNDGGAFVATNKVVQFLRAHIARGEVEAAARLYEDSGSAVVDELLAEAKVASSNSQKNMAQMFTLARDFASAATVFEAARDYAAAARSYEQANNFSAAARCFQQLGDLGRAAAALERAGEVEAALNLYRQAGPSDAMAECLGRLRRYREAAGLYEQLGNMRGEVEMLRLVPIDSPDRVAAVERLADLLERFGRMDQAMQLIVDTVRQVEAARNNTALYQRLARLLEGLGRFDQAQMVRARIQNTLGGNVVGEQRALPVQGVEVDANAAITPPPIAGVPVTADLGQQAPVPPFAGPPGPGPQPIVPPLASAASDPFAALLDPFASAGAPGQAAGTAPVDAYAQLKAIPIFGELDIQDMKDLYRASQEASFVNGQKLIEQGQAGTGLTVVLSGDVQVERVENGLTTALANLRAGAYVGEMSLVDASPTSAQVVAQGPVRALFISRERFDQYIYSHPAAAQRIYRLFTQTLAERLRQSNIRK